MGTAVSAPVRRAEPEGIHASVDEVRLSTLLQLFCDRGWSGTVVHASEDGMTELTVSEGCVDWAWSNVPGRLLTGDILCQMGVTTPAAVSGAFAEQLDDPAAGRPIGSYLRKAGKVHGDDILGALMVQVAETTVRALVRGDGRITARVNEVNRIPTRARLPIPALVEEAAARGEGFRAFNPTARPAVDEKKMPTAIRVLLKRGGSIRELANSAGRPEWALAKELQRLDPALSWKPPAAPERPTEMSAGGLLSAFEAIRTELTADRERPAALRRARRLIRAIAVLEAHYRTHGLIELGHLLGAMLQRLVESQRARTPYPTAALIKVDGAGAIDLGLTTAVIGVLTDADRRALLEEQIADTLAEVLEQLFAVCVNQVSSPLDRRRVTDAFRELAAWIKEN